MGRALPRQETIFGRSQDRDLPMKIAYLVDYSSILYTYTLLVPTQIGSCAGG